MKKLTKGEILKRIKYIETGKNVEEKHIRIKYSRKRTRIFLSEEVAGVEFNFKNIDNLFFKTSYLCNFITGDDCIFNTGNNCKFIAGDNCKFKTEDACEFKFGNGCTFNTWQFCEFTTDLSIEELIKCGAGGVHTINGNIVGF